MLTTPVYQRRFTLASYLKSLWAQLTWPDRDSRISVLSPAGMVAQASPRTEILAALCEAQPSAAGSQPKAIMGRSATGAEIQAWQRLLP